ncbi:hypothetical protein LSL4_gp138 [Pseudomonas phage LSL4]|nr:hypothetical protein LSL4_gp138 [Pseudomonas phage LSL4]
MTGLAEASQAQTGSLSYTIHPHILPHSPCHTPDIQPHAPASADTFASTKPGYFQIMTAPHGHPTLLLNTPAASLKFENGCPSPVTPPRPVPQDAPRYIPQAGAQEGCPMLI